MADWAHKDENPAAPMAEIIAALVLVAPAETIPAPTQAFELALNRLCCLSLNYLKMQVLLNSIKDCMSSFVIENIIGS